MDVIVALIIFGTLGLMTLAALTSRMPPSERAWLLRILLIAFALRLAVATIFALVPESRVFHEDADGYEIFGMMFAQRWHAAGPPVYLAEVSNLGHFYVCGALYYVFGTFRPVPSYFNALLGTATVFVVYRLAQQFFHGDSFAGVLANIF